MDQGAERNTGQGKRRRKRSVKEVLGASLSLSRDSDPYLFLAVATAIRDNAR